MLPPDHPCPHCQAKGCLEPFAHYERYLVEWDGTAPVSLNVFLLAKEMQLDDILYEDVFNILPKEKQSELIGRKADFAKKAGINP